MTITNASASERHEAGARTFEQDAALAQGACDRIELYSLLAGLFRAPPTAALLASLANVSLPNSEAREPDLTTAWRRLQAAAARANAAAVDDEFHALFIGLGRGEILPYASWYLSGFLMDRPLVALRSDLARLGIERGDGNKEPEDHIAALYETMALLVDPIAGVDIEQQRHFLNMHMAPWLGRLFTDIRNAKAVAFYSSVAALAAAFLTVETSWLSLP